MRVRISVGNGPVSIGSSGLVEMTAPGLCHQTSESQVQTAGSDIRVRSGGRQFTISDTIRFRPVGCSTVTVGARSYRGTLLAFADTAGLVVVNELELEQYLFGVVPCEIGPINPQTFEAVKAQAVAARSFALSRLGGRRRILGFDLYDSFDRDQEYRGASRETELGRRAVNATRGQVLLYQGTVCEALFHTCCGGVTASGPYPYLRSVPDTPDHRRTGRAYCSESRNYRWQAVFTKDSLDRLLADRLNTGRRRIGLRNITIKKDNRTGRVQEVRILAQLRNYNLTGPAFRFALDLKSNVFEVRRLHNRFLFNGRGWGHGCGMCQEGAIAMARAGRDYRQILLHYYSGVTIGHTY